MDDSVTGLSCFYCDNGIGSITFWTMACSFSIEWNDWNRIYVVCTDIQAS